MFLTFRNGQLYPTKILNRRWRPLSAHPVLPYLDKYDFISWLMCVQLNFCDVFVTLHISKYFYLYYKFPI